MWVWYLVLASMNALVKVRYLIELCRHCEGPWEKRPSCKSLCFPVGEILQGCGVSLSLLQTLMKKEYAVMIYYPSGIRMNNCENGFQYVFVVLSCKAL